MADLTTSLNRHSSEPAPAAALRPRSASRVAGEPKQAFRTLLTGSSKTHATAAAPLRASAPVPPQNSAAVPVTPSTAAPTAESVFGANPWVANPMGTNPDGSEFAYNPVYFATASTAQKVAQMLGGTVVSSKALAPNAQQQPNLLVEMPDGRTINAGIVASFYSHGYPQSYVDGMIANQIKGTAA